MEYKKMKDSFYLRIDKNEKVVETIKGLCRREKIQAGCFQGIGACGTAVISTYIPEKEDFIDHTISGMIEMISLIGNVSTEDGGEPFLHHRASREQAAEPMVDARLVHDLFKQAHHAATFGEQGFSGVDMGM